MFADGKFLHPDGKARFLPLTPRLPENAPTQEFPLVFNTGRVRDHWHTMTRTGKSARLSAHVAEPYAEINTADALRFKVRAGELATLRSKWGSMVVRVRTGADIPAGMVFAPIHWNRAFASDARVGALTNPVVDPISGEPELKHTPVAIEHFAASWYAVMLTRSPLPPPATQWWTKVQGEKFVRYELAGNHSRDWSRRGAPACSACRRAIHSPTSTGSNIAIRSGASIARPGSLATGSRAASTSTGGRRCPNAPGWRACSLRRSSMRRLAPA